MVECPPCREAGPVLSRASRALRSGRGKAAGKSSADQCRRKQPMKLVPFLLALVAAFFAQTAQAHEVRPAYLEIRQTASDSYDVLFKVPALGEQYRLGLYLSLPAGFHDAVAPRAVFQAGAHVERRRIMVPGG